MASAFPNSIFHQLLSGRTKNQFETLAIMGGVSGSTFSPHETIASLPIVVFDFETTGLNVKTARIIEIGAIKYRNSKEVDRFSTLVNPGQKLPPETFGLTGINDEMLVNAPRLQDVFYNFHEFFRGCVGVAHNAEFDCGIMLHESARLGMSCNYHVICSLKMARALVQSERKNLDTLAQHYNLTFESRHRSIGDILVTAEVLWNMLREHPELQTLGDLQPYQEPMNQL
ncbi:MAG: 3'-5' exonuclease [Betaproteobacteria bacterium]|nr:3'-5' exonuclease [Betaproteobacteria bacterium]